MKAEVRSKAIQKLLDEIGQNASETATWTKREKFSETTMAAIAKVKRDRFMQPGYETFAYINRPQPIGHGQTISQPYIVALMTDLLGLKGDEHVLELGSGSGYQTAILAEVLPDGHVFTVELIPQLVFRATNSIKELGYSNVTLKQGDGHKGWPENAPFDAIIVTAAPERTPDALIEQLKPGGRLVIPLGQAHSHQDLVIVEKDLKGRVLMEKLIAVSFVPMVHS